MIIIRTLLPSLLIICLSGMSVFGGESLKIQIGYCGALSEIDATQAARFDYMELRTSEIVALSDNDYEKLTAKLKRIGLPVPVTYWFLPASIKVTGPTIDQDQQMAYVRKALDRVSRLGTRLIVFGSSGARQVPEGFSKEEAFNQLVEFCKRIAPIAKASNIVIAIEPQRRQESNIINTLAEGLRLVKAVDHPSIQLMVDFYHFASEKDDPAILVKARDHIRHVHLANPENRVFPLGPDEYNYAPLFENLRWIGYDRLISLEAQATDFQKESAQSISFLRNVFAQERP